MAILSMKDAIAQAEIEPESPEVIFIFSTTKGNVSLLENPGNYEPDRVYLWRMAEIVTTFFGNPNRPIVVSNACISGCAAQITAARLLNTKQYKYAVVCGVDVLSKFIISGFQSFKALSPELCRPFDAQRVGLNLGEASATIVYTSEKRPYAWALLNGAICNDANHISAPSRTAEGLVQATKQAFKETENIDLQEIAFVNAHGTATRYNDDMESVALQRLSLNNLPVNSLKGYFGHTLGAAGVLETIISAHEANNGIILPTFGYQNPGTIAPINVVSKTISSEKSLFLKIISGFGGCNAAVLFQKNACFNKF